MTKRHVSTTPPQASASTELTSRSSAVRVGVLPAWLHQSVAVALAAWLVVVIAWPQVDAKFRATAVVLPSLAASDAVLATHWNGAAIEKWIEHTSMQGDGHSASLAPRVRARSISESTAAPIELELIGNSRAEVGGALQQIAVRLAADYIQEHGSAEHAKLVQSQMAAARALRLEEDRLRRELLTVEELAQADRERLEAESPAPSSTTVPEVASKTADATEQRLAEMRLELARLEANYTDQHPAVIALKEQIRQIERQASPPSDSSSNLDFSSNPANNSTLPTQLISTNVNGYPSTGIGPVTASEEARNLESEIAATSDRRKQAEWRLEELVRSQEAAATQLAGRIGSPVEVTRATAPIDSLALVIASLVALLAAYFVRQLSLYAARPTILSTDHDVATLLAIPMIGHATASRSDATMSSQASQITRARALLPWVVGTSETIIAAVLLASITACVLDPVLLQEFTANPLAGMLELSARMLGS